MSQFDFDAVIDRRATGSLKWEKYRDTDILPLWVADMDFASPPTVIAALNARAAHGVFGYTLPPRELAETVIARFAQRYRWSIAPEWIVWLPGLVTGLNVACRAVGDPGDAVMTATPVYPPFLSAPGNNAKTGIRVPLRNDSGHWRLDVSDLERAVTDRTRLYLLCNPHNPVGRMFDRCEQAALLDFCRARDLVVCSDEIHCDLILDADKTHVPFATLGPEAADRCISLLRPARLITAPVWDAPLPSFPTPDSGADLRPPCRVSYRESTALDMKAHWPPTAMGKPGWKPFWMFSEETTILFILPSAKWRVSAWRGWKPPISRGSTCAMPV